MALIYDASDLIQNAEELRGVGDCWPCGFHLSSPLLVESVALETRAGPRPLGKVKGKDGVRRAHFLLVPLLSFSRATIHPSIQ